MGRVFKQQYSTFDKKLGKRVTRFSKYYYIEYVDHLDVTRKMSTKVTDELLARQILAKNERQVERIRAGVIDAGEAAGVEITLEDAIVSYGVSLTSKNRDSTHVVQVLSRLRVVANACEWKLLRDMDCDEAQKYLHDRLNLPRKQGGLSAQSANHYIGTLRAFATRLLRKGLIVKNPFDDLERYNVEQGRKLVRRALSDFTFMRLLIVTKRSKRKMCGFLGEDRAALYLLAASTGLRASELATLRTQDVKLDLNPPQIWHRASETKNRRDAKIPLPKRVAELLRDWVNRRNDQELLLPGKWADHFSGWRIIRADMNEARIPHEVDGQVFDFHALRGQYATMLVRSGVSPQAAKELLRHSDIRLTLNHYTHLDLKDLARELEKIVEEKKKKGI